MRLVVIGGVAAGMSAASQAKRRRPELEVVVLERGQDVSYGACGMPYNVADPARSVDDLVVITAAEFREQRGLDLRLGHEVTELDRKQRRVRGRAGDHAFELDYDALVLATGSRALLPPIAGLDAPGVFTLRTLRDAVAVKAWLAGRTCREAVVVGGSYLGLELAEALAARGLHVTIVKRSPALLGSLPAELDELVKTELARAGVEVVHGAPLTRIVAGERLRVEAGERTLLADVVMVATGFAPRSELALAAGLAEGPNRSIAVDRQGRTADENIFAAGDCADHFHALTGARVWVPLALHANRAGRIVGANAAGAGEEVPPVLGTTAVKVFNLEVAVTGLSEPEARAHGFDAVATTINARTRAHSYPGAKPIHVHLVGENKEGKLLGGAVVGEEKAALRINVIAAALHGRLTVAQFAAMDLMYSPPFAPAWDPLLVGAGQLQKKLS